MAVNNNGPYTWSDLRKQMDPNGEPAMVVDIIAKATALNRVALWKAGNLETGNQTSQLISRSGSSKRRFNVGVDPTKNKYKQVVDTCAMYYKVGQIDADLAQINRGDDGKVNKFLTEQAAADIIGLQEDLETDFFYGNTTTNPDSFDGLAARYGDLTDPNVIDYGDSTGSLSSIYAVVMGEQTAHMIYPKNSNYGIQFENYGKKIVKDANNKNMPAYQWDLTQKAGLVIKDPRVAGRICNINTASISTSNTNLANKLIELYKRIKKKNLGQLYFFCNISVATGLAIQMSNRANAALTPSSIDGVDITSFWKTPILESDCILSSESRVV